MLYFICVLIFYLFWFPTESCYFCGCKTNSISPQINKVPLYRINCGAFKLIGFKLKAGGCKHKPVKQLHSFVFFRIRISFLDRVCTHTRDLTPVFVALNEHTAKNKDNKEAKHAPLEKKKNNGTCLPCCSSILQPGDGQTTHHTHDRLRSWLRNGGKDSPTDIRTAGTLHIFHCRLKTRLFRLHLGP